MPATRRPATKTPVVVASPTPIADPVFVDVPTSTYTIVCESWGTEPPKDAVDCKIAVELALAALGGERTAVRRFEVRYGDLCVPDATCDRRADVRTVLAIAADFDSLVIRVARDGAGELLVWPPAAGPSRPPSAFTPPGVRAPRIGLDDPVEVRDRTPLPLCGREDQQVPDAFDTPARRCFIDGVAAWSPVELVTSEVTATDVITRVFRFTGRGPIVEFVHGPAGWSATASAISPIRTPAVFVLDGPSEPVELHK